MQIHSLIVKYPARKWRLSCKHTRQGWSHFRLVIWRLTFHSRYEASLAVSQTFSRQETSFSHMLSSRETFSCVSVVLQVKAVCYLLFCSSGTDKEALSQAGINTALVGMKRTHLLLLLIIGFILARGAPMKSVSLFAPRTLHCVVVNYRTRNLKC